MQRAGVLSAIVVAASDSQATSLEGISRSYTKLIRRSVAVPSMEGEVILQYLRKQRLWKRYGTLKQAEEWPEDAQVEQQDYWLADPAVPSATGAVTDDVIDEPPQLAAALRLIRDQNYTRTDRGRALLAVLEGDVQTLREGSTSWGPNDNPFIIGWAARAVLLYALLDADYDFLRASFEFAPVGENEFTRSTFADSLNDACRALRRAWVRRARSGSERKLLDRLERWAQEIDKGRRSGREWGGGRPPDQLATLRLEPYVDLGLITKLDRAAYRYRLDEGQRSFFDEVGGEGDAEIFLGQSLFAALVRSAGRNPQRTSDAEVWDRMEAAYHELRSRLGFASFVEVALVAIGRLLEEGGGRYFEVGDGVRVVRARQKQEPRRVRLGPTRRGALTYMKLVGGGVRE
jgi:hypothetical protein